MTSSFRMLPPRTMPLDEMVALYDGLQTINEVVAAVMSQARFKRCGTSDYNEAGGFLDDLNQLIGHAKDYIADAAEERKVVGSDDFADRAHILIAQAMACEGITTAAGLAKELYAHDRGAA